MNVLDALLFGVRNILYAGASMPTRTAINVHGAGVVVTDDVANERTDIEIPGIAGSISWTTVTGLAASATSPLVIGGSQYIGVTHVRTGATPATSKGQLRATDGIIVAAKIDGTDETVLQTAGSTVQIGDDFGPIIERPADASNWYVEDTDGVRLLASSTAVGVNRRLFLYGGSAKTATAKGHVGLDSTGRLTVYADGSEKVCLVTGDAGGGAPSRVVALDANDIIEWNLDETGAPWVDSISGVNLVGYDSGNPSYTPLISYGGSIFGARAPHVNWQIDTGLESAATVVGENNYGTIHGWLRLTYNHGGTVFQKNDPGSSGPYLRFGTIDSTTGVEMYAGIGNSGDIDLLPTPSKSRYRGLVTVGQWVHVAMTWGGGEAFVYVNGVLLPTTIAYSSLGWNGGKWRLGKWTGNLDAHWSKWRVCNVARTAAYIDEVYKRAVGLYP